MARRPKQLQDEITASLAAGTPHPEAAVSDWKKRIADIQRSARGVDSAQRAVLQRQLDAASDGLRAAQKVVAHKPGFVTNTNLFALKDMVVKHGGPVFPSRVDDVDAPHLKRTFAAGLIEDAGGNKMRLTAVGREAVADALVQDIGRESGWRPRENPFVSPATERDKVLARDIAEHEAKIARLEAVLAKIR